MRWLLIVTLLAFCGTTPWAAGDKGRGFRFAKADVGKVPSGWKAEKTGKGEGSIWKVVRDETAPSKSGYVLAQTAESPTSLFNVCVADDTYHKDVDLSVSFKPIAGKNDQGGGFVWRYQDHNNYYIARANPAGKKGTSVAVYKVVDGKRTALKSTSVEKIPVGEWHQLRVRIAGDHIECYLDGKKLLDVTDNTYANAGKVGLWSKSDAQTHFDNFQVSGK
jgi:hypothetical protein